MSINPYLPPKSDVSAMTAADREEAANFYVVAPRKFMLLMIATMSMYSIYWWYKNWQSYRQTSGETIWPVVRAIFSLFFVHQFCRIMQTKLASGAANFAWNPRTTANVLVVLYIVTAILERASWKGAGSPYTDLASILLVFPFTLVLLKVQHAINTAAGDRGGSANQSITAANIIWVFEPHRETWRLGCMSYAAMGNSESFR
jgi:hypothetical protein